MAITIRYVTWTPGHRRHHHGSLVDTPGYTVGPVNVGPGASFAKTEDESGRHARYRMTARLSVERVRAITDAPDGHADRMTRAHLIMLRNELNRLDLGEPSAAAAR